MQRQATTYKISPSAEILKRYTNSQAILIYKSSAVAKGLKFLAFNDSTGVFSIDSQYIPMVTQILIATGIQANFVNTYTYDDYKNVTPSPNPSPAPSQRPTETPVNYNPANYIEYPVRSGEYANTLAQKFTGSPGRWTEIIRKKTSAFLTSYSATQLAAGEILLLPRSWNIPSNLDPAPIPPGGNVQPNTDPVKKKDDDGILFFTALLYTAYKFIF